MIVISACLGGIACRYDGNDNLVSKIEELLQKKIQSSFVLKYWEDCQHLVLLLKLLAGMATTFWTEKRK